MHGPRVCILGGGFGGLYTALRLDSLLWPQGSKPQVTLIDRSERFVFKPLLYELLNGGATADEVAPPFSQLLAPYSINFIQVCFSVHQHPFPPVFCQPFSCSCSLVVFACFRKL